MPLLSIDQPLIPLAGGILIGLGTLLGAGASGVPPGISGLCSEILRAQKNAAGWRLVFVAGMIAGGLLVFRLSPAASVYRPSGSLLLMIVAGLLVGVGTRVGGGCTSGHGVCGIGLGSKRGFAGTLLFMGAAMVTVFVVRQIGGATP